MNPVIAFVGLGGNLGDPKQTCQAAAARLASGASLTVLRSSSLYRTVPVDAPGPDYCNGILEIQTTLSALELLEYLLKTEQDFGRTRAGWHAPRTLDLDLIAYGDLRICRSQLTLPHPRAHERAFVLIPLCELNPRVLLGGPEAEALRAAQDWLAELPQSQRAQVRPW